MKFIVSGNAALSFTDGTRYELTAGIHDDFPENVKKHWAFTAYVKPLDESGLAEEQQSQDGAAHITLLEDENTHLKAQLVDRESTIAELNNKIAILKAQIEAKPDKKQEAGNGKKSSSADS
ncbi:hypothetical protein ID850_16700 [Xenorhabdus sp. Flor]|uniref:hypothetical protein n=1 Tax=Xenorhabdus cabanillasii TaxID=351673 RepID=UPI001993E401|nr:hypothetical protein [Xenorhabdus sp. Flor]MBD2816340.1 hypothetical protein [Xenorhabdus sp. Flor]